MLSQGRKIDAVALLRSSEHISLTEAKQRVDASMRRSRPRTRFRKPDSALNLLRQHVLRFGTVSPFIAARMIVFSATEALSPAIERTRASLFAPFRWGTFLKLCAVAVFTEGFGGNFNFSGPSHSSHHPGHSPIARNDKLFVLHFVVQPFAL